jgi:hypothetical protein
MVVSGKRWVGVMNGGGGRLAGSQSRGIAAHTSTHRCPVVVRLGLELFWIRILNRQDRWYLEPDQDV